MSDAPEEEGSRAEATDASEKETRGPAQAWALDPEVAVPPDFSVVADERLIAYVWAGDDGELRRAKALAEEAPTPLPFGDVLLFEGEQAGTLRELAGRATELDRFRFAVELEGWAWVEGTFQPHARMRRF